MRAERAAAVAGANVGCSMATCGQDLLRLRAVACNVFGGGHAADIGTRIGRLQPDVVALQEVDRGCARTGGADTLAVLADAAALTGDRRLLPTLPAACPASSGWRCSPQPTGLSTAGGPGRW